MQGFVLQEPDDPIEQVWFPQSGMISLLAVMESGQAVETATIGREGGVGILAGLGGQRATGRAVIQLEGSFSQIPVGAFRNVMGQSAPMRNLISHYNDAQIALIAQVAGCNALHKLPARLCRWLLQTRDRNDGEVLTLTQEFLSEMLGVQRTTVTVVCRELQDLGLINYRRGKIEIASRAGLEQKACECYAFGRRKIDGVYAQNVA
jgi:CRP-like cAMP-binding protein